MLLTFNVIQVQQSSTNTHIIAHVKTTKYDKKISLNFFYLLETTIFFKRKQQLFIKNYFEYKIHNTCYFDFVNTKKYNNPYCYKITIC